jgi:amino acid adenylation domain-containing protein/non-ribosomal peptide synthase protein (TIGR01720 family)
MVEQLHNTPLDADEDVFVFPMSAAQKQLWLLDQLEPESAFYNVPFALRLQGKLDIEALEKSLNAILERHEVLRTTFRTYEEEPVQVVHSVTRVNLLRVDLRGEGEREQKIHALSEEEARHPFNLARDLPLRTMLIQLEDDLFILLVTMHHIVADGWSIGLLFQELTAFYGAYVKGEPSPLSPLPVQYADYAEWQQHYLNEQTRAELLHYWKQQLAGAPALLELPTDFLRPTHQTFNGAYYRMQIQNRLLSRVYEISQSENATLFMTLLGAFAFLLRRYTDSEDMLIGTPVTNRPFVELEQVIGFFVNTLALRIRASEHLTFRQLLQQIKQTTLQAFSHESIPFETVVHELQPVRDSSYSPLVQVMFILQNAPLPVVSLPDLEVCLWERKREVAKFDLTLECMESTDGLICGFEYNTDLFEEQTIERMAQHFQVALEQLCARPDAPLATLPLLTEEEAERLLQPEISTNAQPALIHKQIEEQARLQPQAIAVLHQEQKLSYGELDTQATLLARYLQSVGVGPEVPVGICMERCPELIVAIVAVLKAGGCYVPLDPSYPSERLAFMMADSNTQTVITRRRFVPLLLQQGQHTICLEGDWQTVLREKVGEQALREQVTPGNLAYIIYTSGSTGRPKGVLVTHENLQYSTLARFTYYQQRVSCFLLLSSYAFDSSIAGLFWTLTQGGRLVLPPEGDLFEIEQLRSLIERHHVSHLLCVPSLYRVLLEHASDVLARWLRVVIVAGEASSPELLQLHTSRLPTTNLYNEYGPTEATVWCTVQDCSQPSQARTASIGYPIEGAEIYILNSSLQMAPTGVPGDLYVGGNGITRGYLHRPDLTAERFIPHPFSKKEGARLYHTGDRARYLPSGEIEYLGRSDHQAKIRGFRIELGEIEAALLTHPAVQQSTVLVHTSARGHEQLVAYLVLSDGQDMHQLQRHLRLHLQEHLPDYMVPTLYVSLPALPLLPNGKIDRKALPEPVEETATLPTLERATAEERSLIEIWKQVLGREQIGLHDNFFELGGDSIQAIQVVARAREAMLNFQARDLFQYQTVAQLARVVTKGHTQHLLPPVLSSDDVPLTPIQHWFFEQRIPNVHHWNQSLWLSFHGQLKREKLERALLLLARRHDALRLRFHVAARRQTLLPETEAGRSFTLRWLDARGKASPELEQTLIAFELSCQTALHLEQGPLLCVGVVQLAEEHYRLFMAVHHLVMDGVSWRVLAEELNMLYRDSDELLPARTTSYAQWAFALQAYAKQVPEAKVHYWLTLAQEPFTPLPTDERVTPPAFQEQYATQITQVLPREKTAQLLHQAPRAYHTRINDLLLTALSMTLEEIWGQHDLLLEMEGHGRGELIEGVDLSRTVGWFTSLYPVGLHWQPKSQPGERLKSIKEQLRRVPEHGIYYSIVRYLGQNEAVQMRLRDMPHAALTFNYLGQFEQETQAGTNEAFMLYAPLASAMRDATSMRPTLLSLDSLISNGCLQVTCTYSTLAYREESIKRLLERFLAQLSQLIEHCLTCEKSQFTPSDFPLARLEQRHLDSWNFEIEDIYPLSYVQQGMLFHTLLHPGKGVYSEQLGLMLNGELHLEAFLQAWKDVLKLHPVLRSSFYWDDLEEPIQIVHRQVELPVTVLDWRGEEYEQQLAHYQENEQIRGFDFQQAPLMRLTLIRLTDTRWYMLWSHHHILMDGWCLSPLFTQLFSLYQSYLNGQPLILPPQPAYRDYIKWLRQQDYHEAEQFWKQYLKEIPPQGALSTRAAETEEEQQRELDIFLRSETSQALIQVARRYQVTLHTLFQSIWALLLSFYSGKETVVFGSVVSGRPADLPGVEEMVGPFINTIPVRLSIRPDASLADWLSSLREEQAVLNQYELTPLVFIQQWCGRSADTLFDTVLVFYNYPLDMETLRAYQERVGFTVERIDGAEHTNYPLTLAVIPDEQIQLSINYNTKLVQQGFVQQVLADLETLATQIAVTPEIHLHELLASLKKSHRQQQQVQKQANQQKLKQLLRKRTKS